MGQKYRHHPRSTVKIRMIKRMKMMSAVAKNGLVTNSPGYNNMVGMVPVRKPIGQTSVNINPIRAVVRKTRPMRVTYLI